MKNQTPSRREFLKFSALGMVLAPFAGILFGSRESFAAKAAAKDATKGAKVAALPDGQKAALESDAVAAAVGYKEDSTKVDTKKFPQFKKGQRCSSCALYTSQNEGWGKCQLIQNGLVSANGWCGSYSKKA